MEREIIIKFRDGEKVNFKTEDDSRYIKNQLENMDFILVTNDKGHNIFINTRKIRMIHLK